MKNRFNQVKTYVKDHAPEIITAAGVIAIAIMTRNALKDASEFKSSQNHIIGVLNGSGKPFTFYPGVGTFSPVEQG